MSTLQRSRTIVSAFAAMLMVALSAPIAVHGEDQPLPVEEQAFAPAAIPDPSVSVADRRVRAAQHALLSPDLGSLQEEALLAVVATAMAWEETSGYGAVEASRAAASALFAPLAAPTWDETSGYGAVEANRAEPDVSVAPAAGTMADAASGLGSVAVNRVTTAQHALEAGDLGSLQEEALAAVVAAGSVADASSVDDALASTRAALLAQFRAVELSSSRFLGAAQQESASCDISN